MSQNGRVFPTQNEPEGAVLRHWRDGVVAWVHDDRHGRFPSKDAGANAEARDAEARDAALQKRAQGLFRDGMGWVGLGARARREIALEVVEDGPVERAAGLAKAGPLSHPDLVTVALKVPKGVLCLPSQGRPSRTFEESG